MLRIITDPSYFALGAASVAWHGKVARSAGPAQVPDESTDVEMERRRDAATQP